MNRDIIIEVCCGSYEDVVAAKLAGAHRVELNAALFLGGLTPSLGTLRLCKKNVDIQVMPMVRPRTAGFLYSDYEYEVMKEDARLFIENGADGLVFGFLDEEGAIDKGRTAEFVKLAGHKDAIFHRAFDVVKDPFQTLEELIELGVTRILTSGQEPSAIEGQDLIKELIQKAKGRIEILPGAGIRKKNVKRLVEYTGADQVHFSAGTSRAEPSVSNNRRIHFGGALYTREDVIDVTSREEVEHVIESLK